MIPDGRPDYVISQLPSRIQVQRPPNSEFMVRVKENLRKIIDRGYTTSCDKVESLTHFFLVSKTYLAVDGKKEIDNNRMVYDVIRSGLNEVVWELWFLIPMAISLFRSEEAVTYMGECDIGDIFVYFMFDPAIRPHAGVDFKDNFKEKVETAGRSSQVVICERIKMRVWERMMMGFTPSPYMVTKGLLKAEWGIYMIVRMRFNG